MKRFAIFLVAGALAAVPGATAKQKKHSKTAVKRHEVCLKKHPDLSSDRCWDLAEHRIWVGMTLAELREAWPDPCWPTVTKVQGHEYLQEYFSWRGASVMLDNGIVTMISY